MKKTQGIVTAVILCLSLILSVTGCGKTELPSSVETTVLTVPATTAETRIYPELPDADFGGYIFNILNFYDGDDKIWSQRDIET